MLLLDHGDKVREALHLWLVLLDAHDGGRHRHVEVRRVVVGVGGHLLGLVVGWLEGRPVVGVIGRPVGGHVGGHVTGSSAAGGGVGPLVFPRGGCGRVEVGVVVVRVVGGRHLDKKLCSLRKLFTSTEL